MAKLWFLTENFVAPKMTFSCYSSEYVPQLGSLHVLNMLNHINSLYITNRNLFLLLNKLSDKIDTWKKI